LITYREAPRSWRHVRGHAVPVTALIMSSESSIDEKGPAERFAGPLPLFLTGSEALAQADLGVPGGEVVAEGAAAADEARERAVGAGQGRGGLHFAESAFDVVHEAVGRD